MESCQEPSRSTNNPLFDCGRPVTMVADCGTIGTKEAASPPLNTPLAPQGNSLSRIVCLMRRERGPTVSKLPMIYRRKVRMTSSRHDPYGLGYTRVTMAVTKGSNDANRS